MARKSRAETDTESIQSVLSLIKSNQQKTLSIRAKWLENFQMFVEGSRALEKKDWQADFSVNEFGNAIRNAAGNVRSNFLRRPNWFLMKALTNDADKYKPALEKAMRFHLQRANFRQVANTSLLCASINMSVLRVGWKIENVKNPKLIIKETQEEIKDFNRRMVGQVENIQQPAIDFLTEDPDKLLEVLEGSYTDFQNYATSKKKIVKTKIPEFIQRGVLELTPINAENFYWDADINYMNNCSWQATEDYVPLWKLKELEKLGVYKNVASIGAGKEAPDLTKKAIYDQVYKGTSAFATGTRKGLVKVTEYFGHLIIDDEIREYYWHLVFANDSVVLLSKMNPFWGDGYELPYIVGSAHEIPFRPTGQGIGDNATKLQKAFDSNLHLLVDQMRLGIVGLNIVNKAKLADPSQLLEGVGPGEFLETTDDPEKVFKHVNLTSNVENQVFPANEILRAGIQKVIGMSDVSQGSPAPRSRTSATEITQMVSGGDLHLFNVAEDLEINILLPMLEKSFARILQYGLSDLTDPTFQTIFDPNEIAELKSMSEEDRYNTLANYFQFEINGFTNDSRRMEEIQRLTELLDIYNKPGPLSSVIRGEKVVKELVNRFEFRDPEAYINDDNELNRIDAENRLLMLNQQVQVMPNDNHQQHIQLQSQLPNVTQAQMAHVQQHQMYLAQIQQAGQNGQQQAPPMTDADLEASSPQEQLASRLNLNRLQ